MAREQTIFDLFFGAPLIQSDGVDLPRRGVIDVRGGSVTDDPDNGRTIINIPEASGSSDAPPIANASTGTINNITSTSAGVPTSAIRCSGAAPIVTGIASGTSGRKLVLHAAGGPLTLVNESGSSNASNRIITSTGANLTIGNGHSVVLVYDGTSQRWRVVGVSGVSGSPSIAVSADGKALELNKHAGPAPTTGTVRLASGGVGGTGFDCRMAGIDPADGTTPRDIGLYSGWVEDFGGSIGIQNVVNLFGDWENLENKSPELVVGTFRNAYAISYAKKTPQDSYSGMSLARWITTSPVVTGFDERRSFLLDRHTNFVLMGTRNAAFNPEAILGGGEGVMGIGYAEVVPTSAPTLGAILWCDPESSWLKYIKADGDVVVLSGPGGDANAFQIRNANGTFEGVSTLRADDESGDVVFNGGVPRYEEIEYVQHVLAPHSEIREARFAGNVTNASMPDTLVSIPILSGDHSGLVQLIAHACWYSEGQGSASQILLVRYWFHGGVLTFDTPIDQTPAALVYPPSSVWPSGCTAHITTHTEGSIRYVDAEFRANGDTRWSGTLTVTMTEET